MEITKAKYKEILEIQMVSYNENSRWFTETLSKINQALQPANKCQCNLDCPDVEYGNCCHPKNCQKQNRNYGRTI